ncbi:MAG: PAS domain S-box protein, partial [Alphaproteobacteria bacterium]|nr:PAS domain S-box protein [Alphaproteobacteria bacterium]
MISRWLASSIIHRFAAAAGAIALLMGVLASGASYLVVRTQVWSSITDRLEGVAELTARRAELIFEHILADATALAQNPIVANALVDSRGRESYLKPLIGSYRTRTADTITVGLYDFAGHPYVVDGPNHPVAKDDPAVLSAVAGRAAARIDGDFLIIALPVIFPATRQPEGALVARASLAPVLARAVTGTTTSGMGIELSVPGRAQAAQAATQMIVETPLSLASPLAELDLSVIVRVDEEVAMRPLVALTRAYVAIGLVTTLTVFLLATAIGHRLAGPLVELSRTARAVAIDGRVEHSITVVGQDEVADLALALREMLSRIEVAHRELETRVDDRTEALRAKELELTLQASRLSAILENVIDGIISIDRSGIMLSVNPAAERLFGWTAHEMIGRNVNMLMPEPHHTNHDSYLARYLNTGQSAVIGAGRQLAGLRRDGSLFPMELAVSLIRSEIPVFVGVIRDVTDRVASERAMAAAKEAAEEANQRKSEFLATMTHEIRTPMNGVLGMLNILLDGELTPGQRRNATVANRSAQSLLALINDILDYSKVEAGHLTLDIDDFDLADLITEAVEIVEAPARDKGILVEAVIAPDVPRWLKGDRSRLLQVLLNLMSNAVKFTERGRVKLSLALEGRHIRFEIVDTGIGIAASDQPILFT